MKDTIDHFMWGYQVHYRAGQQAAAETVLGRLDPRLRPVVFVVGILGEERSDRYAACVEPEDDFWADSESFVDVPEFAKAIRASYPEAGLVHSHPLAQKSLDEHLSRRAIRDAILEVIARHPSRPADSAFFASLPEEVDGYLVSVVLSVQDDILNAHYRLATGAISLHECRQLVVSRSLLDAAIAQLLDEGSEDLLGPDPGLRMRDRDADETIRSAGRHLASQTALRADPRAILGHQGFFHACNAISSLTYEQTVGEGKLVLARSEHEGLEARVTFADAPPVREHRRVRKLLELARHGMALHTNSATVFGLVDADVAPGSNEDLFEVLFVGHHHWQLTHANRVLMGVRYGVPYLPAVVAYETKLHQDLPRLFPEISGEAVDLVVTLTTQAKQERHGTLLVISSEAPSEAMRLRGQATLIEPCLLTPALLRHLTGIDGAVLLDPNGCCHAIGVILDGYAQGQGQPSRGARFNSALRYVETSMAKGINCLAVVVSEDGGMDLIPDLLPPIRRYLIDRAVAHMSSMVGATTVPWRRYTGLHEWLDAHRFYLTQSDCDQLNEAVQAIETAMRAADPTGLYIVRRPFTPHTAMDPLLYYVTSEAAEQGTMPWEA